jgi:hypothetical protein
MDLIRAKFINTQTFCKNLKRKSTAQALLRGQGTIEYLVVIAVVVVFGLIVVGLLSDFMGDSSKTVNSSIKIGMISGPIAITDVAVDPNGNGIVNLSNHTGETLTITKINFCGADNNYSQILSAGENQNFALDDLVSCACNQYLGKTTTAKIIVYGSNSYDLSHNWPVDLIVDCVSDATILSKKEVIYPIILSALNASCGSATTLPPQSSPPATNLCFAGTLKTPPGVDSNSNYYFWTCLGQNGGTDKNCSVAKVASDTEVPTVTLLTPANNYSFVNTPLDLNFSVHDSMGSISECKLILDNSIVQTKSVPIQKDTLLSFSVNSFDLGNHYWDVNCIDASNNEGTSFGIDGNRKLFYGAVGFAGGSGTAGSPYLISNCFQLNNVRDYLGNYFKLANDINCSMTTSWNSGAGFTPIAFSGDFNGAGHLIKQLYIYLPSGTDVGLFGTIGGNVYNLGVTDANITGDTRTGILAGYVRFYEGGTISSNYSSGYVKGNYQVGGLIGQLDQFRSISNCYSVATVDGSLNSGGFMGSLTGVMSNCYSAGTVQGPVLNTGGLIGWISDPVGNLSNSFAATRLLPGSGGLMGSNSSATITNSFWDKNISGINVMCADNYGGKCSDLNGVLNSSYFYFDGNNPIAAWGTWQNVSGNKWKTSNNIWGICRGQTYPWLFWENKTC